MTLPLSLVDVNLQKEKEKPRIIPPSSAPIVGNAGARPPTTATPS